MDDKIYSPFFSGFESLTESKSDDEKTSDTVSENSNNISSFSEVEAVRGREPNPLLDRLLRTSRTKGESLIQIPDSIVIVRPPRGVFVRMVLVNSFFRRVPALLLRRSVDQNTVLEIKKQCREIAERAWEDLASVYPFAYANSLTSWRYFNDSYDEKKLLITQKEREVYVVIPVIDETGMLFTVLKHMCVVRRKLRQTMDVSIVDVLNRVGDDLRKELGSVLDFIRDSTEKR